MKYKKLSTDFTRKGLRYVQKKRTKDIAIYEVIGRSGNTLGVEVIKIGRHEGYTIGRNKVPAAEFYPNDESFSCRGWYYGFCGDEPWALSKAKERFKQLLND